MRLWWQLSPSDVDDFEVEESGDDFEVAGDEGEEEGEAEQDRGELQGKTNSPANWFIKSETFYNEQVYLGGYNISKEVADKCSKSLHYNLTLQNAQSILSNTGRNAQPTVADGYIYFPPSGGYQGAPGYVNQQAEGLMRVSYSLTPTGPMSLVGKSDKSTFHPFDIAAY
ncbi:unnamed protein product [Sphagnum balticum]